MPKEMGPGQEDHSKFQAEEPDATPSTKRRRRETRFVAPEDLKKLQDRLGGNTTQESGQKPERRRRHARVVDDEELARIRAKLTDPNKSSAPTELGSVRAQNVSFWNPVRSKPASPIVPKLSSGFSQYSPAHLHTVADLLPNGHI